MPKVSVFDFGAEYYLSHSDLLQLNIHVHEQKRFQQLNEFLTWIHDQLLQMILNSFPWNISGTATISRQ